MASGLSPLARRHVPPYIEVMEIDDSANQAPPPPAGTPGLHRSATSHLLGGVAGGIGERFDIDPVIVRVAFVVLACFWGLGVAVYLAMWVLVPSSTSGVEEIEVDSRSRSRWLAFALLAGLVGLAVIVVTTIGGFPQFGRGFALLWLVFLVVLAILALRHPARQHRLRRFVAISLLAVVSLFIVLLGAGLSFLASTGVPMTGGSGDKVWQPTSLAQVQHAYRTEFGTSTVDLASVTFPATGYAVTASVSVGILTIEVPANAVIDLRTHVGAGRVFTWSGYLDNSISAFSAVPSGFATAGEQARAPHLTIDASVGVGKIDLVRVDSAPENG